MTDIICRKGNMTLKEKNGVQFLTFPALDELGFIRHSVSTRIGGVSTGPFGTMNLKHNKGEPDEIVNENYHRLCDAVGYDFNKLVASKQDHHTVVRKITAEHAGIGIYRPQDKTSVDGLITDVPGMVLCTYYADCTPLFFVDPVKKAIGVSHAGWRGTVAEMARYTVEAMTKEYRTDPADIIAAIGPSIGQCCYEVDTPVIEAVRRIEYVRPEDVLNFKNDDHAMLDMWKLNRLIMEHAGVRNENIYVGEVCTRCNNELLYSHRVLGLPRGTFSGMLSIKEGCDSK